MEKKGFNFQNLNSCKSGNHPFALSCLRAFVPLFLTLYATCAWSQNWEADVAKASHIFTQDAFEVEVEQLLYPSITAIVPIERQTVWFYKQNNNFHLKQYGTEVISNDRYTVIIRNNAQTVIIERSKPSPSDQSKQKPSEGWEQVTQAYARLISSLELDTTHSHKRYVCTYLGQSGGSKSYCFDFAYGDYEQSIVFFSSKTGLLERVSTIFREPQEIEPGIPQKVRLDFVYKKQQSGKRQGNNLFSLDDILAVNAAGEVKLKGKYSEYQLLNHLK